VAAVSSFYDAPFHFRAMTYRNSQPYRNTFDYRGHTLAPSYVINLTPIVAVNGRMISQVRRPALNVRPMVKPNLT
jgi:hypothetical protein